MTSCRYAKDIGHGTLRGGTVQPTHLGIAHGSTTYLMPCTEACYNGDYTKCPVYREPEENESN